MRNNYLTMLAQKSNPDTPAAAPSLTPAAFSAEDAQAQAFKAIVELTASPEFQSLGDHFPDDFADDPVVPFSATFDESPLFDMAAESPFLTSPHESLLDDFGTSPLDTPFSDFLATPMMAMDDAFMESPLIRDNESFFGFTEEAQSSTTASATNKLFTYSPSSPLLQSMDSPVVPTPAPAVVPATTPAPAAPRRRNVTGTRKNLTPDSLLGLEAPTQKRNYTAPSATSRKALPAGFVRKRGYSAAFGIDEHDADEVLPELSPTASEQEQIEHKRRQNTLAARKSRKRKLEHQQGLEAQLDDLKRDVTMWRERALMAQEMLRSAGIKFNLEAMDANK